MEKEIKLDVFGKKILAIRSGKDWSVFYLSGDGKRRSADDIIIPSFINENEIKVYLADLCHEWATEKYPNIKPIK